MSVFSHLAITQGVDGTLSEICASPLPSSFFGEYEFRSRLFLSRFLGEGV